MKQIVYFFSHKGTTSVKIGMTASSDVTSRFQAFCCYAPHGAEIYGIIKTENARQTEALIHKELSHRRLSGEFFNITKQDCENIINRYNSGEINSVIAKFFIWLSKNDATPYLFDCLTKNTTGYKTKDSAYYEEILNKYFDTIYRDRYMTTTEIKEYIETNQQGEVYSIRSLGLALKIVIGKSKSVSINGVILNRYHIGLKELY